MSDKRLNLAIRAASQQSLALVVAALDVGSGSTTVTESDVVRLRRAARRAAKLGAGLVVSDVSDGRFHAMPTKAETPDATTGRQRIIDSKTGAGRPHNRGGITLEFEIATTKLMCNSTSRSGVTHSDRITLNVPSYQLRQRQQVQSY